MGTSSLEDLKTKAFWKACLAELIGTGILVLIGCGSASQGNLTSISLCFGFTVASVVWGIGHVSGGHINPAVTIGFLITRKITIARTLFYIIFQVIGAILGALLVKGLFPGAGNLGSALLSDGVSAGQGFGIEFCMAFILMFVVLASVDEQRTDKGGSIPLTIGLVIAMCCLCAIPFTGCGMNPARSFGPALISDNLDHHWLYWAGPIAGAALAALIYDFVFAVNASPEKIKGYLSVNYSA